MNLIIGDSWALALILATLLLLVWKLVKVGRRPSNYPPGPPTLPLIGNLHQIPDHKRHLQFEKWARQHGPVYSLMLGNSPMIVLSSDHAIKDLVDKRGGLYSSRPEAYIAQDILSGGLRPLFMPDTGPWKVSRKLAHRVLSATTARTYVPYQDLESKVMLLDLLENPNDFVSHMRRFTTSLTTQMTFGYRTTSVHDPKFMQAFDMAALLDLVPALRWVPDFMLPIKKESKKIHKEELALFRRLYLNTKRKLHQGIAQKSEGFSDDEAAYIGGSILQAGSETTATTLMGFIQAAIMFPDVITAAQAELDRVCGDRMPDLNDVPDLPYIRACAKESLRWMPGFMLGVPHALTKDDMYRGYKIPKGSTIVLNVWAIHNDPVRYHNPDVFDPMRFLGDHHTSFESANCADAAQRDHFSFGAGRRRCQGMHIADRSLFLGLSRLLWAFDLKRVVDSATDCEIVPCKDDLTEGSMIAPAPFEANIVPRSSAKAKRVREEWEAMAGLLDGEDQWKEVPEGLIWQDEGPLSE